MRALYRKYRPTKLSDVVGQTQVTDTLEKSLAQGKISHAYLFTGPRGTGKTSVARIFAHAVNGFHYEVEDDYVDIIEIDGASNRGIDNIRELREKAAIAPTSGKYKIYIIDEVHMLTKEAFNALLKTLEEPPEHVIFIMATTDAHKVPVTITSRAQTYNFQLASADVMLEHLKKIAAAEKIKITDEALGVVVRRGGGSFRDSLSLLDQISTLSDDEITLDVVTSAMGLPEDEKITELLMAYLEKDVVKITTILKTVWGAGIKSETFVEGMVARIIDEPRPEFFELLAKLPEVKAPFADAKLLIALVPAAGGSTRGAADASARETIFSNKTRPAATQKNAPVIPEKNAPDITETKFDWNEFVDKVRRANDAVAAQLLKTQYEFRDGVLEIYPEKRIVKTILRNNKKILVESSSGVRVEINDAGTKPMKDETLTKISDIMGGEVKNDGGENPFG